MMALRWCGYFRNVVPCTVEQERRIRDALQNNDSKPFSFSLPSCLCHGGGGIRLTAGEVYVSSSVDV